jgi:formylglycine-generating enzyme required for sulfatase activity
MAGFVVPRATPSGFAKGVKWRYERGDTWWRERMRRFLTDLRCPLTLEAYKAQLITIAAGPFFFGSSYGVSITLPEFRIGKTPVTVGMWQEFCQETGSAMPKDSPDFNVGWMEREHPMVRVSWHDVQEYATWAQLQLPSETQWEKAARGTDGREYPWGKEWERGKCHCSQQKLGDRGGTAPVGLYPEGQSPYGALDMAGNVWEWCSDWYDDEQTHRNLRGGSWFNVSATDYFRCAFRSGTYPDFAYGYVGFRLSSATERQGECPAT